MGNVSITPDFITKVIIECLDDNKGNGSNDFDVYCSVIWRRRLRMLVCHE